MTRPAPVSRDRLGSVSSTTSARKRTRRSGYILTCANCRRRKTRCDGGQPSCLICQAYHDDCCYDKAPPMSQITWMAQRIQELEQMVSALRIGTDHHDAENVSKMTPSPLSPDSTANATDPQAVTPDLPDLNVDANGRFVYYGSTSALEQPFTEAGPSSAECATDLETSETRSTLVSNALHARNMEDIALGNAALRMDIPRDHVWQLLNTHWTWIHPVFMFVYRPAFIRDMGSGGKYFSKFLLSVMCCHSTRFTKKDLASQLLMRVRLLMGTEIQDNISIPTIQALLQFSARELGQGSVAQGWCYSGVAFRMASDLGLFNKNDPATYTAEDREIRKRLAWSCFCWDKAVSLYLGRTPALREPPMADLTLLDDSAEHETWQPYFGAENDGPDQGYPAMPSYSVSCFINHCKLAVIINDMLVNLYGGGKLGNIGVFVRNTRQRLEHWLASLPSHLRIDTENIPPILPPPHIISLNLQYHTSVILLHRPFRNSVECRTACRRASQAVEAILLRYGHLFGFARITYLMAYCIYTAATVVVEDLKDGFPGDRERIDSFLEALECAKVACPAIQRSIDIISRNLTPSMASTTMLDPNYIPTDPALDPTMPTFPFLPLDGMSFGEYGMLSSNHPYFSTMDSFLE